VNPTDSLIRQLILERRNFDTLASAIRDEEVRRPIEAVVDNIGEAIDKLSSKRDHDKES